MTARPRSMPPVLVHVAGEPQPDHLQRCVPCGTVLNDNRSWWAGTVAVMDGDDTGPSWWPVGALVATDKEPGSHQPSITYVIEQSVGLDDNERPCVSAR